MSAEQSFKVFKSKRCAALYSRNTDVAGLDGIKNECRYGRKDADVNPIPLSHAKESLAFVAYEKLGKIIREGCVSLDNVCDAVELAFSHK